LPWQKKNQKLKGGVKMKKAKPLKVLPLVFLMILLFFSFSYGQKQEFPQKADKLELTSEQKEKIRDLRTDSQKEMIKLRADLKIARLELEELLSEDRPDRMEIYRKIEEMGDLKVMLQKNRIDERLAMREILTPEQLDKLKTLRHKRGLHRRQEGRERFEDRKFRRGMMFERSPNLSPEEEEFVPMERGFGMLEEESDI
jgi:Spy/CpxP family protein refolding chaperone